MDLVTLETRPRPKLVCPPPEDTFVQQHFKDETTIDSILKRYNAGDVSVLSERQGAFLDASDAPASLEEAFMRVEDAKGAFMDLPSDVRQQFGNDPLSFARFVDASTVDQVKALFPAPAPEPEPEEPQETPTPAGQ